MTTFEQIVRNLDEDNGLELFYGEETASQIRELDKNYLLSLDHQWRDHEDFDSAINDLVRSLQTRFDCDQNTIYGIDVVIEVFAQTVTALPRLIEYRFTAIDFSAWLESGLAFDAMRRILNVRPDAIGNMHFAAYVLLRIYEAFYEFASE